MVNVYSSCGYDLRANNNLDAARIRELGTNARMGEPEERFSRAGYPFTVTAIFDPADGRQLGTMVHCDE